MMGFSMGEENLERRRFPHGGASRTFDCDTSDLKRGLVKEERGKMRFT